MPGYCVLTLDPAGRVSGVVGNLECSDDTEATDKAFTF